MQRRDFLKSTVAVAVAAELGIGKAQGKVAAHNWINYDFGSGPPVADRLNQGPFPQYPPDALIPTDDVVMTTTPSEDVVPNYGKGLVTLHHGRQWRRRNQVRQYSSGDRRPGSISPGGAGVGRTNRPIAVRLPAPATHSPRLAPANRCLREARYFSGTFVRPAP
jgi:hypothetical protein